MPPVAAIPPASVLFGASEPEVVAAYFLDPSCSICRDEFRDITAAIREGALPRPLQLRIYHYPRVTGGCFPEDYKGDEPASSIATENHACIGALAIECVELLEPGMGIRMAGEIFDLQRTGSPYFTSDKIARAARSSASTSIQATPRTRSSTASSATRRSTRSSARTSASPPSTAPVTRPTATSSASIKAASTPIGSRPSAAASGPRSAPARSRASPAPGPERSSRR
ncbi:MAG: hypothetical protein R3B09_34720 [Nannocystaceae bacterium]